MDRTGRKRVGRIVEVEGYAGPEDRASHARFGRTARNGSMFRDPGTAYVYLVYGMHDCLNIAARPGGTPSAILVRAIEPVDGLEWMRAARVERAAARRRSTTTDTGALNARIARLPDARIGAGPGLVSAAFSIDRTDDGADLLDPNAPLRIEPGDLYPHERIVATPRIGIDYAGEPWVTTPWRFVIADHPSSSGSQRPSSRT